MWFFSKAPLTTCRFLLCGGHKWSLPLCSTPPWFSFQCSPWGLSFSRTVEPGELHEWDVASWDLSAADHNTSLSFQTILFSSFQFPNLTAFNLEVGHHHGHLPVPDTFSLINSPLCHHRFWIVKGGLTMYYAFKRKAGKLGTWWSRHKKYSYHPTNWSAYYLQGIKLFFFKDPICIGTTILLLLLQKGTET